jgi:hypothetical protein
MIARRRAMISAIASATNRDRAAADRRATSDARNRKYPFGRAAALWVCEPIKTASEQVAPPVSHT